MEETYLMWLARVTLHNTKKAFQLLGRFGTAENVFYAEPEEIRSALGNATKLADTILSQRDPEMLDEWMIELEEKEISFYSYFHPSYPYLLKQIYDPPLGIYVKGVLPDDHIDKIGVIGARRCSQYGASVAYRITKDLGQTNVIVVSGMAKGIDAVAPYRNRIISGLSKLIVVIEAGKRSGTLITADLALENGRDVFVLPGNVTSKLSEGTNNLIKQGCPIITESGDILEELGISYQEKEKTRFYEKVEEKLTPEEREIYEKITEATPVTAEELSRMLDKPIQDIQYVLSLLEITGYIRKLQQAGYVRS